MYTGDIQQMFIFSTGLDGESKKKKKKSRVSFLAAESCQIKICIPQALKMREGDLTYPRATFPPFSEFLPIAKVFGIYCIL